MKSSSVLLSLLPLLLACADDGDAGKNSLVATSKEAAGTNCDTGGLKVESGLDANGNGKLEATEVAGTEYICSGENGVDGSDGQDGLGAEDVTTRVSAATPAQCPSGGQQVQFLNPAGEATGDPVVVCGADAAQSFGSTPVVQAHRAAADINNGVTAGQYQAGSKIVLSATITTPRAGVIITQGDSLVYCSSPSVPPADRFGLCAAPVDTTSAALTIVQSTSANQAGNSGQATIAYHIPQDRDSQISTTNTFALPAGTYTFNMLGMSANDADVSNGTLVYYGASNLTLVFIPTAS